jgi:preprotein translocase subunit SecG
MKELYPTIPSKNVDKTLTFHMLHNIWIICSIALIFFIILHNPKSQNLGSQAQLFGSTRTAEESINKITWSLTGLFFLLTIVISASSSSD